MIDVSIVIVNYNTAALTTRCIESIVASEPQCQFEIILVDNASTDDSASLLPLKFPMVRWVQQKSNLGYAIGLNAGAKEAKGKYLVMMNSDTWIKDNILDVFLEAQSLSNNENMLFVPILLSELGDFQKNTYAYNASFRELLSYNLVFNYFFPLPQLTDIKALNGACLFMSNAAYQKMGGFDEDFFLYSEEFEFCKRFVKNGGKLGVLESIKVYHENEASSSDKSWNLTQRAASIALLFLKTKGRMGLFLFFWIHGVNLITNAIMLWKMDATFRKDYLLGVNRTFKLSGIFFRLLLKRYPKPLKI